MYRRSIAFCLSLWVVTFSLGTVGAAESGETTESKSTWVTSIARLGESDQFVASTADGLLLREATVFSLNASDPSKLTPLYVHPAAVWCVDAASDGGKVASVDYRGNLVVFDVAGAEAAQHEKAFERWCQAMSFSPDNQSVVAGNEAGKIMVWDLAASKVTKSAELEGHAVTGLAWSPDGTQLAASDGGGHVHLLKWPSLEVVGKIKVCEETAWCVVFVNDGKDILVGSSDRNLYRAPAKADAKAESVVKGTDWITRIAVSPSGQVAAAEVGGKLHFPSTGGTDSMDASSGVWALCWNGDAQLFAGTRKDGIVIAGRSWKWTQPAPPVKPAPEKKEEPAAEKAKPDAKEMKKEAPKEDPKAAEKKAAEKKAADKKAADKKAADKKAADKKAADEKAAADKKAAEKKAAAEKPADESKQADGEKKDE